MPNLFSAKFISVLILISFAATAGFAQKKPKPQDGNVRTVTIPISIFGRDEKAGRSDEFVEAGDIQVKENGDDQTILSIRSVSNTPLEIAIVIQDDLTGDTNNKLGEIKDFIRALPEGSRVLVGYLRGGSLQVRQKFTEDLDKAANSLRIIAGSAAVAPGSPYVVLEDALKRFDAQPAGRRAVLLFSDGLDTSRGFESSSPAQNIDLDRAILKAQRKSIAVYSIYVPTTITDGGNSILVLNGQGSLNRLSEETGGRAFFQGTIAPISFEPFFPELKKSLTRQFALTYLSTHLKKGYYKIQVTSTNPQVKIEHPRGYYFK